MAMDKWNNVRLNSDLNSSPDDFLSLLEAYTRCGRFDKISFISVWKPFWGQNRVSPNKKDGWYINHLFFNFLRLIKTFYHLLLYFSTAHFTKKVHEGH